MVQTDARVLIDKAAIRDAATIIVLRDAATPRPRVLMGQRGKNAAFMPSKFVFPGGAVDDVDDLIPLARPPSEAHARKLATLSNRSASSLIAAATRELWEETGQLLGARSGAMSQPPPSGWRGYLATGHLPDGAALDFIFRAVTPPGRPRRFDARFFLADASALVGDPDDFSGAEDELSHLHWAPLDEVRSYDMPFITEVVLAELSARIQGRAQDDTVPFFDNSGPTSHFRRI